MLRQNPLLSGAKPLVLALLAAVLVALPVSVASAQPAPPTDLVSTAAAAGQFTTLAAALQAAGLTDTLKTGGPYTVLAPTDAAFAKIPPAQLQALLADRAALTKVLTYHVIPGTVPASQVVTLSTATPLEGEPITISTQGGTVTLNGTSKVTATDIHASNGIIHVIDTVLLPPSLTSQPATPPASSTPTTASDGQSLASQTPATQALFNGTWGARAATQWVAEHEAAIARR